MDVHCVYTMHCDPQSVASLPWNVGDATPPEIFKVPSVGKILRSVGKIVSLSSAINILCQKNLSVSWGNRNARKFYDHSVLLISELLLGGNIALDTLNKRPTHPPQM